MSSAKKTMKSRAANMTLNSARNSIVEAEWYSTKFSISGYLEMLKLTIESSYSNTISAGAGSETLGSLWKKITHYEKQMVAQIASMLNLYSNLVETKRISIHHMALAAASAVSTAFWYSCSEII